MGTAPTVSAMHKTLSNYCLQQLLPALYEQDERLETLVHLVQFGYGGPIERLDLALEAVGLFVDVCVGETQRVARKEVVSWMEREPAIERALGGRAHAAALMARHQGRHFQFNGVHFYATAKVGGRSVLALPFDEMCKTAVELLVKEKAYDSHSAWAFQSFLVALIEHTGCSRAPGMIVVSALRHKLEQSRLVVIERVDATAYGVMTRGKNTSHTIYFSRQTPVQ